MNVINKMTQHDRFNVRLVYFNADWQAFAFLLLYQVYVNDRNVIVMASIYLKDAVHVL